MPTNSMTYQDSGFFSKLIIDYLNEKQSLKSLYNRFPIIENFQDQIVEKQTNYPFENRNVLALEIEKQYSNFTISEATSNNINLLKNPNSFTITTGHQLNLFTGPLYFLYKIISTINLCNQLKLKYPNQNFIPVYWMASEDHDFEEINYFNFKDTKIKWNHVASGPVGRLSTENLDEVFEQFTTKIGNSENANSIKSLFYKSYLEHTNLADATRYLANELFKSDGLVIVDGDSINLKRLFIPYLKKELLEQNSFKNVTETNKLLNDYFIQVKPREINLFYIENNLRERIVLENNHYKVLNTNYTFSESEILKELENYPEKFSPNVILRPLYQEVILPNLCYIGGGGEIAYWLELKTNFEINNITFPILLLRNSVVLYTDKQQTKMEKLKLTWDDLFLNQNELINKKTKEFSKLNIDFRKQKEHLKNQFDDLHKMASFTDKSFLGALKAQETKQINGLDNLEKRLLKAEKKMHSEALERIKLIQNELFPNQTLQERVLNFSEVVLESGFGIINLLKLELLPLERNINLIKL